MSCGADPTVHTHTQPRASHTQFLPIMRPLTLFRACPYLLLGAGASFLLINLSSLLYPAKPEVSCPHAASGRERRNGLCPCSEEGRRSQAEMEKLMRTLIGKLNTSLDVIYGTRRDAAQLLAPPGGLVGKQESREQSPNVTSYFQRVVTAEQKEALYVALVKLSEVSKANGYTWMLYSGTLLGSFRHHDMVPWDDDFDIFMNYTQRLRIVTSLSKLQPTFHLFEAGSRLKFWSSEGTIQSSKYPWKWPYLDISFYQENATHIWDGSMEADYGDRLYVYPKSIVFPLHLRPMDKYLFPAPRDSFRHLQLTYKVGGLGMCWTTHYSHKREMLTSDGVHKIMCEDLKDKYPFVHRSVSGNGVLEVLMFNGKEIHRVIVEEPKYAITDPYSVRLMTL